MCVKDKSDREACLSLHLEVGVEHRKIDVDLGGWVIEVVGFGW